MSDVPVLHDKRGHAFWITINRPDKRNALNASVIAGIVDGFRRAHEDNDVRVIVLTGAGDKAFCVGAEVAPGFAASSARAVPGVLAIAKPTPSATAKPPTRPTYVALLMVGPLTRPDRAGQMSL